MCSDVFKFTEDVTIFEVRLATTMRTDTFSPPTLRFFAYRFATISFLSITMISTSDGSKIIVKLPRRRGIVDDDFSILL